MAFKTLLLPSNVDSARKARGLSLNQLVDGDLVKTLLPDNDLALFSYLNQHWSTFEGIFGYPILPIPFVDTMTLLGAQKIPSFFEILPDSIGLYLGVTRSELGANKFTHKFWTGDVTNNRYRLKAFIEGDFFVITPEYLELPDKEQSEIAPLEELITLLHCYVGEEKVSKVTFFSYWLSLASGIPK